MPKHLTETGNQSISGTLSVTGATTLSSLALSTPLPITSGGTGGDTAGAARTALGLGVEQSPTFANLTASGNISATGNITASGVSNTLPNQTAATPDSILTRQLADDRYLVNDNASSIIGLALFL
jgi:hypothetical protein